MKTSTGRLFVAAILCLGALPRARAAEVTQEISPVVQGEWQKSLDGTRQAKPEEYHPIRHGEIDDRFTFSIDRYLMDADYGNYVTTFEAKYVGQLDQSYVLKGGKPGSFGYKVFWDQTPHIYSYDARSPYRADGSILRLDQAGRSGTAAKPNFDVINSMLVNAPLYPLYIQNEKVGADLVFHPGRDWTLSTGASRSHRYGSRGIGATFGTSLDVEVPEPVDQAALDSYFDVAYAKKAYQLDFRYGLSSFTNSNPVLIWDSPWYRVDGNATPASGRMPLWPDNLAHSFNLSGGVDLPGKTHFSAETGFSMWRQDQDLVPYTINTALTGTPCTDPTNPTCLPMRDANRKVNIYTQTYRLANSWFKDLRASLAYRSYIYENRSTNVVFPGFVQKDASWANVSGGAYTPRRFEYRKDAIEAKADYDVTEKVALNGGYTFEYKKEKREVTKTVEHTLNVGTTVKPVHNFFVNVSYLLGLRRARAIDLGYYMGVETNPYNYFERPGLVRYDLGDRNRNQGRLQMQYNKGESSYGMSVRVTQDHYRPGIQNLDGNVNTIAPTGNLFQQYGLEREDSYAAALNVSQQMTSDVSADVYYEMERARRMLLDATGGGTQRAANDFRIRNTDVSNVAGIAVNWQTTSKSRTSASYDVVSTKQYNANASVGPNANVYTSLNPTRRMTQTIALKSRYQLTKALALTGRYAVQIADVTDYMVNNIPLLTNGNSGVWLGASQVSYVQHVAALGMDYRF